MSRKPLTDDQAAKNVFMDNMWKNFFYEEWGESAFVPETVSHLWERFMNQAVIIIGAGPSLDRNIEEFCEGYRGGSIVIATDGAMLDLMHHGFRPDFVITSEGDGKHTRSDVPTTEDLLTDDVLRFYRNIPLIATTWANQEFIRKWRSYNDNMIYWYVNYHDQYQHYFDEEQHRFPYDTMWPCIRPKVHMVGFHAIALCSSLMASHVTLLGFDMMSYPDQHHSEHFNMDWDSSRIDLITHYAKALEKFEFEHGGDFGILTFNCTEGGALQEANTSAICVPIKTYLEGFQNAAN